ncbi:uncharacterized protein LOC143152551 isoform X2 [Ptiloglossa arizonensis]|uniref:uncharacterized protein LOC143152551 isoform X2 n=1 Tax=Ptiloglossa arizonensis TaxID=3350558 RepID=UPI003FA0CF77
MVQRVARSLQGWNTNIGGRLPGGLSQVSEVSEHAQQRINLVVPSPCCIPSILRQPMAERLRTTVWCLRRGPDQLLNQRGYIDTNTSLFASSRRRNNKNAAFSTLPLFSYGPWNYRVQISMLGIVDQRPIRGVLVPRRVTILSRLSSSRTKSFAKQFPKSFGPVSFPPGGTRPRFSTTSNRPSDGFYGSRLFSYRSDDSLRSPLVKYSCK